MKMTILTALTLLLVTAGCGTGDADRKLALGLPPLPEHEISHYRVSSQDTEIGSMTVEVKTDWLDGQPVYILTRLTRTRVGELDVSDSSVVTMRQDDLRPVNSVRVTGTDESEVGTSARYGEGSITVSLKTIDGEEHQRLIPMTANTFDVEQLLFLGRALRLEPGRARTIQVIEPLGSPTDGNVRPGEFRNLGDETIEIPAGEFNCRKIELTLGDLSLETWYEKTGTNRMVSHQVAQTGLTYELTSDPDR